MRRLIWLVAAAGLASPATAAEFTAGGYLSFLVLGPHHELYDPTTGSHLTQPLTLGVGGRGGVVLTDWLDFEAELDFGMWPVQGGTTAIAGLRAGPRLVLRDLLGEGNNLHLTTGVGDVVVMGKEGLTGRDADWALHVGPGVELALSERLGLRADVRALVTSHLGDSPVPSLQTHATLGVSYRFGPLDEEPEPAPTGDTDGDGLLDDRDSCVDQAETQNGYLDDDGCPDELAALVVTVDDGHGRAIPGAVVSVGGREVGTTDQRGLVTVKGLMPGAANLSVRAPVAQAAAQELTLAPGANQATVDMDWLPGALEVRVVGPNGKPAGATVVAQAEGHEDVRWTVGSEGRALQQLAPGPWTITASGDGLREHKDTVEVPAGADALYELKLELVEAKVDVGVQALELRDVVHFETGKAQLRPESVELLREVAEVLKAHPEVKKLRVEGHTDSEGDDAFNLALSQARVDEVVRVLVANGVASERLSAAGFGETRPVASNDTPEGRMKNRRVEFFIDAK